jgi:hypothetical protein
LDIWTKTQKKNLKENAAETQQLNDRIKKKIKNCKQIWRCKNEKKAAMKEKARYLV